MSRVCIRRPFTLYTVFFWWRRRRWALGLAKRWFYWFDWVPVAENIQFVLIRRCLCCWWTDEWFLAIFKDASGTVHGLPLQSHHSSLGILEKQQTQLNPKLTRLPRLKQFCLSGSSFPKRNHNKIDPRRKGISYKPFFCCLFAKNGTTAGAPESLRNTINVRRKVIQSRWKSWWNFVGYCGRVHIYLSEIIIYFIAEMLSRINERRRLVMFCRAVSAISVV